MMKKLVALLIALSMIFSVCAWAEESETPISETIGNPADTITETDAPAAPEEGETPPAGGLDARKLDRITLFYGIWLCRDSAELPHGFEVSSIRIVGRDGHR